MENNQKILENFNRKCEQHNIWYSLCGLSLLEFKTNKESFSLNPFHNKVIEIMMTVESYKLFLKFYKDNILDSLIYNDYWYTSPFYFEDGSEVVIKINLLVRANNKKSEKMYSFKNMIRQKISFYKTSNKLITGFAQGIKRIWYKFLNLFLSPITWQEISSGVFDEHFKGYFLINSFSVDINHNWIPSLTFEKEKVVVDNVETYVFKEWEQFLNKIFGFDWKKSPIIKKQEDFNWIIKFVKKN